MDILLKSPETLTPRFGSIVISFLLPVIIWSTSGLLPVSFPAFLIVTDKRLLFELYVHKENLKRTLCQGIFANMQDLAIAKLRRRKQRDEGTTGLEKKKAYTLKEMTFQILGRKPCATHSPYIVHTLAKPLEMHKIPN